MPTLRRMTLVLDQVGSSVHSIVLSLLQMKKNNLAEDKKYILVIVAFKRN